MTTGNGLFSIEKVTLTSPYRLHVSNICKIWPVKYGQIMTNDDLKHKQVNLIVFDLQHENESHSSIHDIIKI